MALKQEVTRLLIADDVGVGKTIEALLIARELYERKEIKRFAVVCLPHLCDQWQDELKNKFGVEAVIIRSGTASAIERQIRTHENIFRAFPFQIISIDYIKTGTKRQVFIDHCPEFVIVDEAHTCARPSGANNSQQLRHHLLHDIAKKDQQHLVLLTATPHSGKQEEFQSLLGLLNRKFEHTDVITASTEERKELAKHFIQRRRKDVIKWLDEETHFPERESIDKAYLVGAEYGNIFDEILAYAREIVSRSKGDARKQRFSYWEALALLRGIMSSPAAGMSMLLKKADKKEILHEDDEQAEDNDQEKEQVVLDPDVSIDDNLPMGVLEAHRTPDNDAKRLRAYAKRMEEICGIEHDVKAKEAVIQIKDFLDKGFNPIVFCRYIQTALYIGGLLKEHLRGKSYKNVQVEIVTSELEDELRKAKIDEMSKYERRVLVATDCLSEGINLQNGFNAVLHYDLPWNPNRLEQREGRIDRFGQQSPTVQVALLYGSNNPIDGAVLEVLLRKAREIRKTIGISIPFPEKSASVMEALTKAILLKPTISVRQVSQQLTMFDSEEIDEEKNKVAKAFDAAEKREVASRSIFAQNAIRAQEIEDDLKEIDEAIGDPQAVEDFVIQSLAFFDVKVEQRKDAYRVYTTNIPERLRTLLTTRNEILISFKSPTPQGHLYIGRNHPFTEQLCQFVLNNALEQVPNSAARTAVIRTSDVEQKTTLFQFRVRNVIAEQPNNREIVAEEMWLWGYEGEIGERIFIDKEKAMYLLTNARAAENIDTGEQAYWLNEEMAWVNDEKKFRSITDHVALERAEHLVQSHARVRRLVGGIKYKVVEPVLPMDVLGLYVFLPLLKFDDTTLR